MSPPPRNFSRFGILLPVAVCLAATTWFTFTRIDRVNQVSALADPAPAADPASPTGYRDGWRQLIVPERNENSQHWIMQAQQMLASGPLRLQVVTYDNAPAGRRADGTSPYRWWLGLVGWFDHKISGRSPGLAVEHAALWADPILHLALLLGTTAFVAWRFTPRIAALAALYLAAVFPLAASFLPATPDSRGLACALGLASVLTLLPGLGAAPAAARRWFGMAGVGGGLGLWVSAPSQTFVVLGLGLGALLATLVARRDPAPIDAPPWRMWGLGGGVTVLLASMIEYFPAHLADWKLATIHPLYGVAWIGLGELLAAVSEFAARGRPVFTPRRVGALLLAIAAIAALPVAMKLTDQRGFLTHDVLAARLTSQPGGVVARNILAWWREDGGTGRKLATLAPLLVLVPALMLLWRRPASPLRAAVAVALGPVLVALALATMQLSWWAMTDALLLALLVPVAAGVAAGATRWARWSGLAALGGLFVMGAVQVIPARFKPDDALTSAEAESLIDRNLARWLALRLGREGGIIYAPPTQTANLCFFGGLRGVGTYSPQNSDGLRATITIASVSTMDEALVLLQARQIRYVLLPSWDSFYEEYPRLFLAGNFSEWKGFLIPALKSWRLPPWLKPVAYQLPRIGGYEAQSVVVLELGEEANIPAALGRVTEYFVETGDLARARALAPALRKFPGDLGTLAAAIQVALAGGNLPEANAALVETVRRVEAGGDRYLPWDRRVSLALALARGQRTDLARNQLQRLVAEANAARIRSLSPGSLFGLLVLSDALGQPFPDPALRALAVELLPPGLRANL